MADFWSLVIGIVGMAIVCIIVLGCIEIADARQHARYRRAQQDRVKARGFSRFHEGGQ